MCSSDLYQGSTQSTGCNQCSTHSCGAGFYESLACTSFADRTCSDNPKILFTDQCNAQAEQDVEALASAITVAFYSASPITSATLRIRNALPQDRIAVTEAVEGINDHGGMSQDGVISLTGSAMAAQYTQILQSVTFEHSGDMSAKNGVTTTAFVDIEVCHLTHCSTTATKCVNVTAVNDKPVLKDLTTASRTYTQSGAPIRVAPGASIADKDNVNLDSVTFSLDTVHPGDLLGLAGFQSQDVAGQWDATTGTFTLRGVASLSVYAEAISKVVFSNTKSSEPSTNARGVSIVLRDLDGAESSAGTRVAILFDAAAGHFDNGSSAVACSVGSYQPDTGSTSCIQCAAGTFGQSHTIADATSAQHCA